MNEQLTSLHGKIRQMADADLELILTWRNHPEIRKYMYTQHSITLPEHRQWYESASKDSKRHLLIYEENSIPLGYVNINQLAQGGVANWGFYIAPYARKGTGQRLGKTALAYAFRDCSLHKICGEALAFNEKSIKFHAKLGFKQEGIFRQHHFDSITYHDIFHFGLLAAEWKENSYLLRD